MDDTYQGIEIPPGFRELTDRHQRNIANLIEQLQTVGLDHAAIEAAVDHLMITYRAQLVEAVKAVGGIRV